MNPAKWFAYLTGCMLTVATGCQPAAKHPPDLTGDDHVSPAAALEHGPTLVDLTGNELGLGGGFLIGAEPGKISQQKRADAIAAAQKAEQFPAQLQQVIESKTADLNNDGYVTLDEVVAMARAGLNPQEISDRLTDTHYVFHITPEQVRYLTDRGVKPDVVATLRKLNQNIAALQTPK